MSLFYHYHFFHLSSGFIPPPASFLLLPSLLTSPFFLSFLLSCFFSVRPSSPFFSSASIYKVFPFGTSLEARDFLLFLHAPKKSDLPPHAMKINLLFPQFSTLGITFLLYSFQGCHNHSLHLIFNSFFSSV